MAKKADAQKETKPVAPKATPTPPVPPAPKAPKAKTQHEVEMDQMRGAGMI